MQADPLRSTSPLWGVYSGYELYEHEAVAPGSEEYLDSEKYELRTNSKGEAPAEAQIDHEVSSRSGLWKQSEMKIRPEASEKK